MGPRLPVPAERAARPCASPLASSAARPGFGARGRQRGPGRRVPFISISRPPTLSGLTPASPDRVWPSLRAACARCCFCHLPNARCARGAAAGGPASRAAASQGRAGGLCIGRARWWGDPRTRRPHILAGGKGARERLWPEARPRRKASPRSFSGPRRERAREFHMSAPRRGPLASSSPARVPAPSPGSPPVLSAPPSVSTVSPWPVPRPVPWPVPWPVMPCFKAQPTVTHLTPGFWSEHHTQKAAMGPLPGGGAQCPARSAAAGPCPPRLAPAAHSGAFVAVSAGRGWAERALWSSLLLGPVLLARACRCPALRSPGTGKRSLGKAPGQGPLPLHLQSPIAKYTPDAC